MSQFNRKSMILSAAVASVIGVTDVAMAQQATLEEVVVTARKREESLQQVPMAVSAFSTTQLRDAQVDNIVDLERMTPNVTLTENSGLVAGGLSVFIRGIGQDPGFGQGVGIYLDDVYLNRTTGALLEVYDVERIEVLKGPQGNLYGRNTIGGAIKYITKQPSDQFEADVEAKAGEDGLIIEEGDRRGTFLPSVWESLPRPPDFLRHLKIKAGLPEDYWSQTLRVQRYGVESFGSPVRYPVRPQ